MSDQGFGHGAATATLTLPDVPGIGFGTGPRTRIGAQFGAHTGAEFGDRIDARIADLDLVVDLGARIGSRRWWRGLATCTALCASAIAFWPTLAPLTAERPAPLTASQWQEARAQAIAPLAYGADTGRRMAATAAVEPLLDTPERPSIDLSATLGRGDGFVRVLERSGVGNDEAVGVAAMVGDVMPLGEIAPGTRMTMTLGRRPNRTVARPLDTLGFRARFDLELAVRRVDGHLRLVRTPIAVDDTPLRIRGRVGAGLYLAARAAGAPAKAVESYLRALGSRMAIGDVRADDRFDLIVEHRRAATGETETGKLLYAGLDQAGKRTQLLEWEVDGRRQWYEASGVGERRGAMRAPVIGHITSGFGMRFHPILGFSRFHRGLDFGAAYGSPIVAASDGVVTFAGWHGGHGNYVMLRHGGGMATAYGHMSRIVARPGAHVAQGQVIGYVGSTGLSTGPHLHYEVYRNNVAINPATVQFTTTALLDGAELARFRATLARLLSVPVGGTTTAERGAGRPAG